jgi:hypothetical protein
MDINYFHNRTRGFVIRDEEKEKESEKIKTVQNNDYQKNRERVKDGYELCSKAQHIIRP